MYASGNLAALAQRHVCEVWYKAEQPPLTISRCAHGHVRMGGVAVLPRCALLRRTKVSINHPFLYPPARSCTAALSYPNIDDKTMVHILMIRAGAHLSTEVCNGASWPAYHGCSVASLDACPPFHTDLSFSCFCFCFSV